MPTPEVHEVRRCLAIIYILALYPIPRLHTESMCHSLSTFVIMRCCYLWWIAWVTEQIGYRELWNSFYKQKECLLIIYHSCVHINRTVMGFLIFSLVDIKTKESIFLFISLEHMHFCIQQEVKKRKKHWSCYLFVVVSFYSKCLSGLF